MNTYQVYVWKVIKHGAGPTFVPESEYPELAKSALR